MDGRKMTASFPYTIPSKINTSKKQKKNNTHHPRTYPTPTIPHLKHF